MRVRRFRESDAAAVARLHRATIRHINNKDYPPEQVAVWSEKISTKRIKEKAKEHFIFVVLEQGKIVGFGHFNEGGEIGALYVHKEFQSRGVGRLLLKKIEEQAYKKGVRSLHLKSTITAREFYKRQGFKVTKKTVQVIRNQRLKVYEMRKKFSKRK